MTRPDPFDPLTAPGSGRMQCLPDPFDPVPWRAAQARLAHDLARAAAEVGRLDGLILALPEAEAQAARHRLALAEVEAMMWAQGIVLRRDEIGRDLMGSRTDSDAQALRLARWALRRLDGQGDPADLGGFLGLHRGSGSVMDESAMLTLRPRGAEFDAAAAHFRAAIGAVGDLHPLARGSRAMMLWRLAGLSAPEDITEAATWAAREMAQGCEALRFVPMGRHGRRVWSGSGLPDGRMAAHLAAIRDGAGTARAMVMQIARWATEARQATAPLKGGTPARVIGVLTARPLASAADVETGACISRLTAERVLNRLTAMGLLREVTGAARFRLWTANVPPP